MEYQVLAHTRSYREIPVGLLKHRGVDPDQRPSYMHVLSEAPTRRNVGLEHEYVTLEPTDEFLSKMLPSFNFWGYKHLERAEIEKLSFLQNSSAGKLDPGIPRPALLRDLP